MRQKTLFVPDEDEGLRLDRLVAKEFKEYSRSQLQKFIEEGLITLDNRKVKSNTRVKSGEKLIINLPKPKEYKPIPEKIPLEIIFEDGDLLVINKPRGMVVHPAPGNKEGTLVNALLAYYPKIEKVGNSYRPGIVHRLDKDTSGLMMVAKNTFTYEKLIAQLKERQVKREYLALVHGSIKEEGGSIKAAIGRHPVERKKMAVLDQGGKVAVTDYWVQERFQNFTLVRVGLHTGRTHQIRVHFSFIGHPVLGDLVYGGKRERFGQKSQLLHAYKLGFIHPRKSQYLEFIAPLPKDFTRFLEKLNKERQQ